MSEAGLPREQPPPPSLEAGRGEAALRVTFDTNVLLSLFVFADSRFAPLRREVEAGRWLALTSPPCLAEFKRVLAYPLFALSDERQATAYAAYLELVKLVDAAPESTVTLPKCRDRDDQKFLELARDGLAHCLVTADKALLKLRRGQRMAHLFNILTPDEALLKVGAGPSQADVSPPVTAAGDFMGGSEPGLRAWGAIKVGAGGTAN